MDKKRGPHQKKGAEEGEKEGHTGKYHLGPILESLGTIYSTAHFTTFLGAEGQNEFGKLLSHLGTPC